MIDINTLKPGDTVFVRDSGKSFNCIILDYPVPFDAKFDKIRVMANHNIFETSVDTIYKNYDDYLSSKRKISDFNDSIADSYQSFILHDVTLLQEIISEYNTDKDLQKAINSFKQYFLNIEEN